MIRSFMRRGAGWHLAVHAAAVFVFHALSADAGDGRATITVVNEGHAAHVQVRDENCVLPERGACEAARLKIENGICLRDPAAQACADALLMAEGPVCRTYLAHDGLVGSGQRVHVTVCLSPGGFASISIRAREGNAAWHRYMLLNDGDTVRYP